jgi:hypothetical protein
MKEYSITKIRELLESTDTQINRLLTNLRANPADEDLLVNLYRVAKRAGKSVTFSPQVIFSPQDRLHLTFTIVDIAASIPAGQYFPISSLNSPPTAEGRVGFKLKSVDGIHWDWYVMDEIVNMHPRYEVI